MFNGGHGAATGTVPALSAAKATACLFITATSAVMWTPVEQVADMRRLRGIERAFEKTIAGESCDGDLAVHQHGKEPVAEFFQLQIFSLIFIHQHICAMNLVFKISCYFRRGNV